MHILPSTEDQSAPNISGKGLFIGECVPHEPDWLWKHSAESTDIEEVTAALVGDLTNTADLTFAARVLDEWFYQWYVEGKCPNVVVHDNGVMYRFVFHVA